LILSSFKALNMSTFVVTESNRGIGLAITTQLAALPSTSLVIASAHTPEKAVELNALANASAGKIVVVKMDTSSLESMKVSFLSLLVEGGGR
jgi:NAD(P)-dependent dehydrogenase (short-subunit alcohol dehydrogenase family)